MIRMILAMDLEGGIGKDGTLPWHFPEDLKRFKKLTKDSVVVMGKNTWNDPKFPKPLKGRETFVCSRDRDTIIEPYHINAILDCEYDEIPIHIESLKQRNKKVWIIGGAKLYNQMMAYADVIAVTLVKDVYNCDTFIDGETLNDKFKITHEEDHGEFSYNLYTRISE